MDSLELAYEIARQFEQNYVAYNWPNPRESITVDELAGFFSSIIEENISVAQANEESH